MQQTTSIDLTGISISLCYNAVNKVYQCVTLILDDPLVHF